MKQSKDEYVRKFLDDIASIGDEKYRILQKLREIVFRIHPTVKERMMYGGIMFSHDEDFGGIFAYKKHISFEFGNGVEFDDPEKQLEGSGKFRRHLKLKVMADINDKQVKFFVKQTV